MADRIGKPSSQRQLRVGEMIKQSLSMIFMRNEACLLYTSPSPRDDR